MTMNNGRSKKCRKNLKSFCNILVHFWKNSNFDTGEFKFFFGTSHLH